MPRTLGELEGRTFAAVLFDMDGTLVDSTPAVFRSWIQWAGDPSSVWRSASGIWQAR